MPYLLALIVALAWPLPQTPPAPRPAAAAADPASGSKIWVGRYEEFEEFIRSAPLVRTTDVGSGVTRPKHGFFAPGGVAGGVLLKDLPPRRQRGFFESYKSEIAAYLVDRLLELDMVPPTVERQVEGRPQSAQLWLEGVDTFRNKKDETPADGLRWIRQVNRQKAFDNLIGNIDENEGNLLIDAQWNLVLADHSRCFTNTTDLPFAMVQIDRPLFERIKALDEATVRRVVGPWLEQGGIEAMMKRRDAIVAQVEKLAAEKGEAAVLTAF
jgi:hypothetical protein